jgi:hypothetical protein
MGSIGKLAGSIVASSLKVASVIVASQKSWVYALFLSWIEVRGIQVPVYENKLNSPSAIAIV